MHFSFQRFFNLKNQQKPQKTHKKPENTGTSELESIFVETVLKYILQKLQKLMKNLVVILYHHYLLTIVIKKVGRLNEKSEK